MLYLRLRCLDDGLLDVLGVLNSFAYLFDRYVFFYIYESVTHIFLLVHLGNILDVVLDSVIVSNFLFTRNIFNDFLSHIFSDLSLVGDVLDPGFTFNRLHI